VKDVIGAVPAGGPQSGAGPAGPAGALTDRYVWSVVRELPVGQRADIELELRGLIEDMTDDGPDGRRPERDVLVELGDPARLAERYRGSARALIGPALYPHWVRTTRMVVSIVVPLVAAGVLLGGLAAGDGAVRAVASSSWAALIALVNVVFWSTLGFAVAERQGTRMEAREWSPEDLGAVPVAARPGLGETIGSVVVALATAAFVVAQQVRWALHGPDGADAPFIDPGAWHGPAQAAVAALVVGAVVSVLVHRVGWTSPLLVVNLAANVVIVVAAVWLASSGRLVNAAFIDTVGPATDWGDAARTTGWLLAAGVAVIAVVDSIESIAHRRRR
jgi:hypothetical protein